MKGKVQSIFQADSNRSTVRDEIDAMDWSFGELSRLLTQLEKEPNASAREYMAKTAHRRLDTLVQRAFRAGQIARGIRVPKAN